MTVLGENIFRDTAGYCSIGWMCP